MVPTTGSVENISQNGGPHYICSRSATLLDGLVDAVQVKQCPGWPCGRRTSNAVPPDGLKNAVRRVCKMFVPRVFTCSVSTQLTA
ncbi:hypothetical protein M404DRAFT_1001115 [Pisolithus tinctorius Marx 270]|uniref:Uncharacterized protein n=1 Tax=Pisolithus tinctorius Marx 270 TaxID=870435 RepID=A0A0C3P7J1_PISTI|nr:hypothetical protein M404DRAFT_1001115 [Pisolithus tinctorius Marx 270]